MGMYKKLSGFASVACFAAGFLAFGAAPSVAAPDPNFHIYIAYGQSNMGGTADAQSADKDAGTLETYAVDSNDYPRAGIGGRNGAAGK